MAFWGHSFIFNDIPCEDFDLMLYNIGSTSQSNGAFASGGTVVEDKISNRWKPFFYGTKKEDRLEFSLVFGVNEHRADRHEFLDRHELEAVASWLTGHNEYLWLEIEQEDMEYVRYHCMITELEIVEHGLLPWALKAKVFCDGPYAYLYPQTFEYVIDGQSTIRFYNESSHNGYYMPKIEVDPQGSTSLTITNQSDGGRMFALAGLPEVETIQVDNENGVLTCAEGTNLYPYFNFKFFRLVPGMNILEVTGSGVLRIICEFPINVGG